MKIIKCTKNNIKKEKYLYKSLDINLDKKEVISFVGGGGKTTSMYNLANELKSFGKKVIVTTTTHMHMPLDCIIFDDNIDFIKQSLNMKMLITVGAKSKNNKISSIDEKIANELINICDFLLVESDGSRMLPLKAPADYEPVLLKNTSLLIGVAGIDSVFNPISIICHRPEIVSKVLNVDLGHIITPSDIAYLLSSKDGQMKGIGDNKIKYKSIINKVDDEVRLGHALEIVSYLNYKNIDCVITSNLFK